MTKLTMNQHFNDSDLTDPSQYCCPFGTIVSCFDTLYNKQMTNNLKMYGVIEKPVKMKN